MSNTRKLEVAANVATVIAVIIAVGLLAVRHYKRNVDPAVGSLIGRRLPIAPPEAGRSTHLILVLAADCHFCTDSASFYRALAARRSPEIQLTAVLPHDPAESSRYLRELGVRVDRVVRASPPAFGVVATPTVLIADRTGIVRHAWVGRLAAPEQREVMARLR